MIALQILYLLSSAYALWVSVFNFRHASSQYASWRDGGDNGLALQVAAHNVRIAVMNIVICSAALIIALVVLSTMWKRLYWTGTEWVCTAGADLGLIMFVGLVIASILNMIKQLNYRYERALLVDVAKVKKSGEQAAALPDTLTASAGKAHR